MKKKLGYFSAIKFLSKYIKRYSSHFIRFYVGWLFDLFLSLSMPIMFGVMIDEIVYRQNIDTFLKISLVVVVMSVFSCLLYFFIYAQHHYLMNMYTYSIKRDLFSHIQKCEAEYMTDLSTGDMISAIQGYTSECMHFVIRNIIHFGNGIIKLIVLSICLFVIDPLIGLFVLIAAPVSVLITTKFGKKIRAYGDKQREYYGGYISWVYEILSALRDIRMLGAENKTEKTFEERHRKMFDVNIKSGISSMNAGNLISLVGLLIELAIYAFAGYLAKDCRMTVGMLTIIISFYGMLMGQIEKTSSSFLDAQNRVSYIQKIVDYTNAPSEEEWRGNNELVISDGEITFVDVTFAYKRGDNVLNGFNLKVASSERLALCGKSGCGKSTLAYMLIGFYTPQNGDIIIDGQRLSECSLKSIRKNIGLVAQDVLIFEGTIRYNIMLGNDSASETEVINACKQAGLWEFVETLPDGLDTFVGSGGSGLSGGQKQRIAIARIYLKNPKIIIFDEATSSLDSETEEQIHEAWRSVLSGRTSIVIAHRQSSVMLCSSAAVIENGKVCITGDPRVLVEENETFKTLFAVKE